MYDTTVETIMPIMINNSVGTRILLLKFLNIYLSTINLIGFNPKETALQHVFRSLGLVAHNLNIFNKRVCCFNNIC